MAQQPGWYPEQPGSTVLRWWDGNQWTQHTQQASPQQQPRSDASAFEFQLGSGPTPDKVKEQTRAAGVGQVGSVAQFGQSNLKKAVRFFANVDQYLTHKLEVRDVNHQPVLMLTRPAKLVRSRVVVERPDGAWNFSITDHTGAEIARITKTWEGFAKNLFTTADNYVVQIHGPLTDPLASLVVGSALTVDTALKQDERGP